MTQPRFGYRRVSGPDLDEPARPRRRLLPSRTRQCATGKLRYGTETEALTALTRTREARVRTADPHPPENRIYKCPQCDGWHLTSKALSSLDLVEPGPKADGEPWDEYAHRLERRVAAQRAQIVSLLAVGHGGTNRELRKRFPALLTALGQITERWQAERRNRENLVDLLRQRHPFTWLLWRLTLGRKQT